MPWIERLPNQISRVVLKQFEIAGPRLARSEQGLPSSTAEMGAHIVKHDMQRTGVIRKVGKSYRQGSLTGRPAGAAWAGRTV